MKSTYDHRKHCKGFLKAHLIFVTKYRKRMLTGEMANAVKQSLYDSAVRHGWNILEMETDKDHVHILLRYLPSESVSSIAGAMKRESTWHMWRMFGKRLKREYWAKQVLWSGGYFFCSIGEVSEETICCYIQNQG